MWIKAKKEDYENAPFEFEAHLDMPKHRIQAAREATKEYLIKCAEIKYSKRESTMNLVIEYKIALFYGNSPIKDRFNYFTEIIELPANL